MLHEIPATPLRRDDVSRAAGLKVVIPAQAGIQRLSLCISWLY
jgi:hypothetical protein